MKDYKVKLDGTTLIVDTPTIKINQSFDPSTGKLFTESTACSYFINKIKNTLEEDYTQDLVDYFIDNNKAIPTILEQFIFEQKRTEKIEWVQTKQIEVQAKGLPFNDRHIQMDADGKANILGIRLAIIDNSYPLETINFKTYENDYITMTQEEFRDMSNQALNYVYICLAEKDRILNLINEATTVAQLDEINWEI